MQDQRIAVMWLSPEPPTEPYGGGRTSSCPDSLLHSIAVTEVAEANLAGPEPVAKLGV